LRRSRDAGNIWEVVHSKADTNWIRGTPIAVSPLDPRHLFALGSGKFVSLGDETVLRSDDSGWSWRDIGTTFHRDAIERGPTITFGQDQSDTSHLYATGYSSESAFRYVSSDGGDTWEMYSFSGEATGAKVLVGIPRAGCVVDYPYFLSLSTDYGTTWREIFYNLLDTSLTRFTPRVCVGRTEHGIVVAGLRDSIAYTQFDEPHWYFIQYPDTAQPQGGMHTDLRWNNGNGRLYAWVAKRGIWLYDRVLTPVREEPHEQVPGSDITFYPSPARIGRPITIESREPIARVRMFDLLGHDLSAGIRSGQSNTGTVSVTPSRMVSGVYILDLTTRLRRVSILIRVIP
jgi:hypothetical protein